MTAGGLEGWLARAVVLVSAAVCIQARLLCNLLDGLVAVEHGRGGTAGPIWNELPDRIADVLLLAGAGYAVETAGIGGGAALGWIAAVLAVLTAYVRELGRGLGRPADFSGPMAKQQRMAVLTGFCLISVFEPLWRGHGQVLLCGLAGDRGREPGHGDQADGKPGERVAGKPAELPRGPATAGRS